MSRILGEGGIVNKGEVEVESSEPTFLYSTQLKRGYLSKELFVKPGIFSYNSCANGVNKGTPAIHSLDTDEP